MKATISKYPDFRSLKEAEAAGSKAQKPAAPDSQQPDLMQAFVAQFSGKRKGHGKEDIPLGVGDTFSSAYSRVVYRHIFHHAIPKTLP